MKIIESKRDNQCLEKKGSLIAGYLVAAYPDMDTFLSIINIAEQAGIDILEIGYPSNDPYDDGEVIKEAHKRTDPVVKTDINYWKKIREKFTGPIWLMGYKKDLIDTGVYRFIADVKCADALVIPDMNIQERIQLKKEVEGSQMDVVGFVSPSTSKEEQNLCFSEFSLIYQQLYDGPTGMPVKTENYKDLLLTGHGYSNTYLFAGFGISTPERVAELLNNGFDGAIIGTAIVRKLNESQEKFKNFIEELRQAADHPVKL